MIGGNIKGMITGAAPISAQILDFLKAVFCCKIVEGYGQTESTAASFLSDPTENITGTVGGVTTMNQMMLEEIPEMGYLSTDKDDNGIVIPRGEVCLKGPGVFIGYFGDPEKTKEAVDA